MLAEPALLRRIAGLLDASPAIAGRSTGPLGVAAAYLPGERIEGIRLLDDQRLEIHVVMRWTTTANVFDAVQAAVRDAGAVAVVDVVIDDIELPLLTPVPPLVPAPLRQPVLVT